MKLSFLPGDLHLSKNADGCFVLTLEGREILKTKSERAALGKFHSLRMELERKYPIQAPPPVQKIATQQPKPNPEPLTVLEHNFTLNTLNARISPSALFEVEVALRNYYNTVEASALSFNSQAQYIDMADRFVRWLRGNFEPGSRV